MEKSILMFHETEMQVFQPELIKKRQTDVSSIEKKVSTGHVCTCYVPKRYFL